LLDFIDAVYAEQRMPSDWSKDKTQMFRRGVKAMTAAVDRAAADFTFQRAEALIARVQDFYARFSK
jgi:hypothetical protein